MIQFRCPHRPWNVPADKSRAEKATARRLRYDVPAETVWTRVDHDYDPAKTVQRKVNGKVVRVPLYAHEKGYTYEADVVCPDCGDTIHISTDQEPEGQA